MTPAYISTPAPRSTATSSSPPPACDPTRTSPRPPASTPEDGRIVVDEHWRDAAQQGLIAGLSAAGHAAAWDKVPGFSCTIGESTLKYCGWGIGYEHSRLVEHHNGFTVWYESSGEVVGVLSLNADEDYRLADQLVRSRSPMTI